MRIENRRTKVREQIEFRAKFQQTALRPNVARQRFPLRPSNRAEEHGIGFAGMGNHLVGKRNAVFVDGRTADQVLADRQIQIAILGQSLEHASCDGGDFRSNAVARQDQDIRHCERTR